MSFTQCVGHWKYRLCWKSISETASTQRLELSNTAVGTPAPVTQMPCVPLQPQMQSSLCSLFFPNRQKLQWSAGCESSVAMTVPPAASTRAIHSFATGTTSSERPTASAPRRIFDSCVCSSGISYDVFAPSA